MSLAIDIKGLQDIVGGELVPYQEIVRDEKAANCQARWPLLANTHFADEAAGIAATRNVRQAERTFPSDGDLGTATPPEREQYPPAAPAARTRTEAGRLAGGAAPRSPVPAVSSAAAHALLPAAQAPTTLPANWPGPTPAPAQSFARQPLVPRAGSAPRAAPAQRSALTDLFKRLESAQEKTYGFTR